MAAGGAWREVANRVVIVGALGYFVDIYDLLIFLIVGTPSLLDLGVEPGSQMDNAVARLLNWQMAGLLVGGILWGVMGDKRGRRAVLFGSIAIYSLANIANAFVDRLPMDPLDAYASIRFIAGLGLAGELGAAVTLVSEALPARLRGYGTMVVSAIGILGAAAGFLVARLDWRLAYITGGVLGLLLLAARIAVAESGMFERTAKSTASRGDLRMFVGTPRRRQGRLDVDEEGEPSYLWFRGNGDRLLRLLKVALVGVPLWCAIGVIIAFSPTIAASLGIQGAVDRGTAVLVSYIGASTGSLASGTLSQLLRSRRLALLAFIDFTAVVAGAFLLLEGASATLFYVLCGLLGFGVGYWAVFVQVAAEQFGTDLRATVTTAAPNLVRGAVVVLAPTFLWLTRSGFNHAPAAVLLMVVTLALALAAAWRLRETYGVDLDYTESGRAADAAEGGSSRGMDA